MRVLVAGFEPYESNGYLYKENPSKKLIKKLAGTRIRNVELRREILPLDKEKLKSKVMILLRFFKPDYVIMFGHHPNATCFEIEELAINRFDDSQNNIETKITNDEASLRKGNLKTTFPIRKLTEAFDRFKIPYIKSTSPGTWYCNVALYNALYYVARKRLSTKVAFVHMPSFQKPISYPNGSKRRLSVDQVVKSLEYILSRSQKIMAKGGGDHS